MKIFQAFSLLTIAHGSKVTRINFRKEGEGLGSRLPPRTTVVRDVGDAVRTQRSGGQPEYEPIRAACNRLAQLSTCTYLLQRRCDSGERRVRST